MNRTTAARRKASRVRSLRAVWAGRAMCVRYLNPVMSILTKLGSMARLPLWLPLFVHALLGVAVARIHRQVEFGDLHALPDGAAGFGTRDLLLRRRRRLNRTGLLLQHQYVQEYVITVVESHLGSGQLAEFIALGYTNPAASSASEDYTIMSLLIFPVFAIVDGRRRGIKHAWLYIGFILFASSAFAWAFYLATVERQRRHKLSDVEVASRA